MLCAFYFDVVTAVCQLLINGYVMLCYVTMFVNSNKLMNVNELLPDTDSRHVDIKLTANLLYQQLTCMHLSETVL